MPMQLARIVAASEPVALGGTRQAASQIPLTIQAWSDSDTEAVRNLWQQAFPVCFRTGNAIPQHHGLVYLAFDFTETPYPGWEATLFTATATAVRGPGRGIVIQPRTYTDLLDEAASYAGLLPLYSTYLALRRGA
jgi:hypothetical protein